MIFQQPSEARPPLDLTVCDQEPIHIPGTIQPHGILFSLASADLSIRAVSANVVQHLGCSPAALLGRTVNDILDAPSFNAITDTTELRADVPTRLIDVRLKGATGRAWPALIHTTPDGVLLEAKLPRPDGMISTTSLFSRYDRATRALHSPPGRWRCATARDPGRRTKSPPPTDCAIRSSILSCAGRWSLSK
jgi:chemotaxis family two-component system sensor kinase Cph1